MGIEWELWLKIPIDAKMKQIKSWNDILLKSVSIDLSQNKMNFRKKIVVDLAENYVGLGSWNPSLYAANALEFEAKINIDADDKDNDEYACEATMESAEITLICDSLENDRFIDEAVNKYLDKHEAVRWKWKDDDDDEK